MWLHDLELLQESSHARLLASQPCTGLRAHRSCTLAETQADQPIVTSVMLRQRPKGGPATEDPAEQDSAAAEGKEPEGKEALAWHSLISVRVILLLLTLFFVMHLFLWKVVYDFAMATDHDRLRATWSDAMTKLRDVRDHLYHLEFPD